MLKLHGHLNQNLPPELFMEMKRIVQKCSSIPEAYLFSACEKHGRDALKEFENNPAFNLDGAQKLAAAFAKVKQGFLTLPDDAQVALKSAMYYFALDDDGNPDFARFDGLDDDILVANVCFQYAGRNDLSIL